jgi:hypothetical protein
VRFRAQAMQDAVPMGTGAMAAILGLDDDAVRQACVDAAQGEVVEAVNFNAPSQVVMKRMITLSVNSTRAIRYFLKTKNLYKFINVGFRDVYVGLTVFTFF